MLTEHGRRLLQRWTFVLVKVGEEFVVPFTAERLARVEADPSYGPDFPGFLRRFLETLAQGDWPPGSYYPGGWYRMLGARGERPLDAAVTPGALQRFYQPEVIVDRRGHWTVGDKPVSGRILRYFLQNLHYDAALGCYVIRYRLEQAFETRYVHHHSPPLRVERVLAGNGAIDLLLNNGRREPLRPETLRLDGNEELYCAVLSERVPAWFEDAARWELLKDAEERDGRLVLSAGGHSVPLAPDADWPYADRLPG